MNDGIGLSYKIWFGMKDVVERCKRSVTNQKGIGTIELIFITVIVLGMAVAFRKEIVGIFVKIKTALSELNGSIDTGVENP